MATATRKAIDYLLLVQDTGEKYDYIDIPSAYRTDGGIAKTVIVDLTTKLKSGLDNGREDEIHGVYYIKTNIAEKVAVPYFELEGATPESLKDCQLWIDSVVQEIAKGYPGSKTSKAGRGRKGYTGIQLSWTS